MAEVRHAIALVLLLTLPGLLAFWFSVHPFIKFWRRMGLAVTLAANLTLHLLVVGALFYWRANLLRSEFGTNPILIALGLPLLVLSTAMRPSIAKQLKAKVLLGFPEIAPSCFPSRLVTEGIYSRIRHPRYVSIFLFFVGCALIANYLTTYILVGLIAAELYLVVLLEERELRARFGGEYEAYARRVPRFIPRHQTKTRHSPTSTVENQRKPST